MLMGVSREPFKRGKFRRLLTVRVASLLFFPKGRGVDGPLPLSKRRNKERRNTEPL